MHKTIKILIIEDNPADSRLVKEFLSESKNIRFDIDIVDRLSTALEQISTIKFDIILSDLNLPDSQGLDTFEKVFSKAQKIPIIVMTGLDDTTIGAKAVHKGAQDYIVKGQVDSNLLMRSIQYAIERKKITEALRESEERFRNLFDQSNDAIFTHFNGEIIDMNQRACELTGYKKEDLINKSMLDLFSEDVVSDVKEIVKKSKQLEYIRYDSKFRKFDGTIIDVELSKKLIDKENFISQEIVHDITERKEAEKKKNILLNELAEKNKELDEYTYIVSHDLKAPLVTIQGFADLLKRKYMDKLDKKALHYFDNIINGAQDMNTLIHDLLELSRAGRKEQHLKNVQVSSIIDSSLRSIQGIINESNAEIKINSEISEIKYDPTQFQQVITNLISNAIKYSKPEKKPEIEIGVKKDHEKTLLWVQDNGSGIAEENCKTIFQPFFRVKRDKKGSGIGLSIVKKIVERHGGNVWVESNYGSGSTFYFTIPMVVK